MTDFSTPSLAMMKLMKEYHTETIKGHYDLAYQIAIDLADVAQNLEGVAKGLSDAFKN